MSFEIKVNDVSEVLLQDGWHSVASGSFEVDRVTFGGASGADGQQREQWFRFEESSSEIMTAGPMSSVLAVRYDTD
ncbi:hypothetical protein [Actinomadura napierensis]|uniref:Uncharacterized protein n=1 Tax=Actinomadura napierensis TaxID=267854 RepID=A0ABP5L5L5_9ACTN